MKLYIKQKVFTLQDSFTIKDERGNDVYTVKGSFLKVPKNFKVYNHKGQVVATIKRKLLKLTGTYTIETQDDTITVRRKITLFRQKFELEGINWQLNGDFFDLNFRIERGTRIIMTLAKRLISWGDTYELDIINPEDALLALCIAICVDYEIEKSRENEK